MKYHFIGDQGISMSGIKKYLLSRGHEVSGSDIKTNGHKAENITPDIDLVVRSSAINPGSAGWAEVVAAKKLGIRVMKRSELLQEIAKDKKMIAISGMHGKTTVTTMTGLFLIKAGYDPTVLVGERVRDFHDEVLYIGNSDWFVMEACEYDRSFLDFYPYILILTNIDEEHLDTYPKGLPEIKEAFTEYLGHVPDNGVIIACKDDANVVDVIEKSGTKAKIIYYGKSTENYNDLDFDLNIPGEHNRLNALAVVALGDYLKIDRGVAKETLKSFQGARRRFEFKGSINGCDIIDDYGHHPTEIKATINALSEKYPSKKKVVVFWPHQYKRIKPLLQQFAGAFSGADEVILKPIFLVPGRDEKLDVSSDDLADLISKDGKKVKIFEQDDEIVNFLRKELNKDSVLLTIGIPPVYRIAEELTKTIG